MRSMHAILHPASPLVLLPLQGLVKNLLDVADNLERAAGSVPEADLGEASECDRDRALKLLRSLREGVLMTDTVLMKVGGWGGVVPLVVPVVGWAAGCL